MMHYSGPPRTLLSSVRESIASFMRLKCIPIVFQGESEGFVAESFKGRDSLQTLLPNEPHRSSHYHCSLADGNSQSFGFICSFNSVRKS